MIEPRMRKIVRGHGLTFEGKEKICGIGEVP